MVPYPTGRQDREPTWVVACVGPAGSQGEASFFRRPPQAFWSRCIGEEGQRRRWRHGCLFPIPFCLTGEPGRANLPLPWKPGRKTPTGPGVGRQWTVPFWGREEGRGRRANPSGGSSGKWRRRKSLPAMAQVPTCSPVGGGQREGGLVDRPGCQTFPDPTTTGSYCSGGKEGATPTTTYHNLTDSCARQFWEGRARPRNKPGRKKTGGRRHEGKLFYLVLYYHYLQPTTPQGRRALPPLPTGGRKSQGGEPTG